MKISTRLVLSIAVPILALVTLFGMVEERASKSRLERELTREARTLALTVQVAVQDALRDGQLEDAHRLIDELADRERILAVRLFDPTGRLLYEPGGLVALPPVRSAQVSEVLRSRRFSQEQLRLDQESALGFLAPLTVQGTDFGAVQVVASGGAIRDAIQSSRRLVLGFAAALLMAIAITVMVATHITVTRPLGALAERVRLLASGDLAARIPLRWRDEIGALSAEFNAMCDKLDEARRTVEEREQERQQIEHRMREVDRLASLGRLAAGLAHEIGTPLGVIRGRAESLRRRGAPNWMDRSLQVIVEQIDRIAEIVRGMLDFARERKPHLAPTHIADVVQDVTQLIGHRLDQGRIHLAIELPVDLPRVNADAHQLHEVFLNLAFNAADAMPGGGTLRIRAARSEGRHPEIGPRTNLEVAVEDTGSGILPEHLDRVFDPFFTTKDVGKGTGLGLSVAHGIVREHGGWIELQSAPGRGTRVTVHLPLEDPNSLVREDVRAR